MKDKDRVQVLLSEAEYRRYAEFCTQKGYKKSTLAAKLIREHLDKEQFQLGSPSSSHKASDGEKRRPSRAKQASKKEMG